MGKKAFSLHRLISRNEFDEIIDVMWEALPGSDSSHPIFHPMFGDTIQAKFKAIAESKQRGWDQHNAEAASHWIYVREVDTEKAVGGCQWRIYDKNPFKEGVPTITAYWWPQGTGRMFASEVVNQCYTPRAR